MSAVSGIDHLLRGLRDDDRERLVASMHRRRYKAGEYLMHEGEPGDSLVVIDVGHVAAQVATADGLVATLNIMGPGDVLGELALVETDGVRSASILALDRVETLSIGRSAFEQLRIDRPDVDRFLVTLLSDHVRRLSAQLRDAYVVDAETRVYRRLLALALSYPSDGRPLVVPVDQQTLASLSGSSRQTANRALRAAAEEGWLVLRRRRLEIVDLDRLRERAR
jgi:CRP/FNR family cyclic AMP-dependent transcriptional regulator